MNTKLPGGLCVFSLACLLPLSAYAQTTINESFNGTSTNNGWFIYGPDAAGSSATTGVFGGGACLTAGSVPTSTVKGPVTPTYPNGTPPAVPGCSGSGNTYYFGQTTLVGGYSTTSNLATGPDAVGKGALRLTNGAKGSTDYGGNQAGAIVLGTPYDTINGLDINFTTVTYGGDGGNGTGADGMSFFMSDASVPFTLGSFGGSLGYACTENDNNRPYFGVGAGFIGIGIDEFGNYQVAGTQTGVLQYDSNNNPIYTAFTPNSITVRGPGNISNASLLAAFQSTGLTAAQSATQISTNNYAAVKNTCANGYLTNSLNLPVLLNTKKIPIAGYPILQTARVVKPNTTILNPIYSQQNSNNPARINATPITYSVNITAPTTTSSGSTIPSLLNFSYSYNGGIPQRVVVNHALNNMPAKLNMGFAGSTGGYSNIHEITCFTVTPATMSASSAGGNVQEDSKVQAGIQIFIGAYNPINWAGSLRAIPLAVDSSTGIITIGNTATWDASCVLTGGICKNTGSSTTAQSPANRTILTNTGSGALGGGPGATSPSNTGVAFQWGSLTAAQKAVVDPGNNGSTSKQLNYYRGDRSLEAFPVGAINNAAAIYRARNSVLGDIINSSSTWVGPPTSPYTTIIDKLSNTTGTENGTYASFASSASTRMNVVYVGANDGMLHGFRAGAYSGGQPDLTAANNDGREIVAYVPGLALNTLNVPPTTLDFSSPIYSHNAYVDATPGAGDLYYKGAWHTWIVGGTGAGGNATGEVGDATTPGAQALSAAGGIFALDVTSPAIQSESAAVANVVGDWLTVPSALLNKGTSNLICAKTSDPSNLCGLHLGSTYGTPIIRRLHNGNWAAIFGNGLDSPPGSAGIYIMNVDIGTGAISFYYIDTGKGRTTASSVSSLSGTPITTSGITVNNGIANVTSADLDGDHVTDYIYAGDVLGNLWRFDLTSSSSTTWVNTAPTLLFSVPATGNLLRPISTSVIVTQASACPATQTSCTASPYLVVDFATGRAFPKTASGAATFASGTQGIYGIWDWDMSAWNSLPANTGIASKQFASRASAPTTNLVTQTLTATTATVSGVANTSVYQELTSLPVCWRGSSVCSGGAGSNQHTGWTIPFPTATEQAIYNPTELNGAFLINTAIPAAAYALSCSTTAATGYTIAVSMTTGGATALFNVPTGTNASSPLSPSSYVGLGLGGVGTNFVVTSFNGVQTIISTLLNSGSVATNLGAPPTPGTSSRITWRALR